MNTTKKICQVVAIVFFFTLCCGISGQGYAISKGTYEGLDLFTRVLHLVEENYPEEVPADELSHGAIKGMLQVLDSHSSYMSPDVFREMQVDTSGTFGGLGIEITIREGRLIVVAPIEGTPADNAGIKAGDWIVKVEGEMTKDMTLMDAVKKMRGPKDTPVTITILRKGFEQPKDFSIVRDIIKIKNISQEMVTDDIGYLRISQFQERSDIDLKTNLQELQQLGATSLIIDLRNNPGGLLDMAIAVADRFLPKGKLIVSTKGRIASQNREYYSNIEPKNNDFPIVVLVNVGSASAAEILAGALQDWGRAVILGAKTFGKGSVQTVIPLGDGSALRLTTARYYTPNGNSIHAKGIVPDILVTETVALRPELKRRMPIIREKDLQQFPSEEKKKKPLSETLEQKEQEEEQEVTEELKDLQLQQAIDILKAERILKLLPQLKNTTEPIARKQD